jgi:hypothetical protein
VNALVAAPSAATSLFPSSPASRKASSEKGQKAKFRSDQLTSALAPKADTPSLMARTGRGDCGALAVTVQGWLTMADLPQMATAGRWAVKVL